VLPMEPSAPRSAAAPTPAPPATAAAAPAAQDPSITPARAPEKPAVVVVPPTDPRLAQYSALQPLECAAWCADRALSVPSKSSAGSEWGENSTDGDTAGGGAQSARRLGGKVEGRRQSSHGEGGAHADAKSAAGTSALVRARSCDALERARDRVQQKGVANSDAPNSERDSKGSHAATTASPQSASKRRSSSADMFDVLTEMLDVDVEANTHKPTALRGAHVATSSSEGEQQTWQGHMAAAGGATGEAATGGKPPPLIKPGSSSEGGSPSRRASAPPAVPAGKQGVRSPGASSKWKAISPLLLPSPTKLAASLSGRKARRKEDAPTAPPTPSVAPTPRADDSIGDELSSPDAVEQPTQAKLPKATPLRRASMPMRAVATLGRGFRTRPQK